MWKGCVLVKAPFSDIHLRVTRKKSMFDYSDLILFFKPYLELGVQMQELKQKNDRNLLLTIN